MRKDGRKYVWGQHVRNKKNLEANVNKGMIFQEPNGVL